MNRPGRPKTKKESKYNSVDWYEISMKKNKNHRYNIERQIDRLDKIEQQLIENSTDSKEPVVFTKIYGLKNKTWVHIGYRCTSCDKTFKSENIVAKHKDVCTRINTIDNTEETFMPIQRITRNGETYYRWGDSGKLYKDRKDAEKQAAAAYASGYKKPENKPKMGKK